MGKPEKYAPRKPRQHPKHPGKNNGKYLTFLQIMGKKRQLWKIFVSAKHSKTMEGEWRTWLHARRLLHRHRPDVRWWRETRWVVFFVFRSLKRFKNPQEMVKVVFLQALKSLTCGVQGTKLLSERRENFCAWTKGFFVPVPKSGSFIVELFWSENPETFH